jgi:DNA-binding NtrC family response regulator
VRELYNLVHRLLILVSGPEITLEEAEAARGVPDVRATISGLELRISFDQPLRQAKEDFEKIYLQYQLQRHKPGLLTRAPRDLRQVRW